MEENIHNDKLEDYVQKSFDDYSEDPSPNMWERIEVDLPPAAPEAPVVRPWSFRAIRWQLVAAAAIGLLLTGLVCEHFYYNDKIRALTAEKERQMQTIKPSNKGLENTGVANAEQPSDLANQPEKTQSETENNHPEPSTSASSNNSETNVENQAVENKVIVKTNTSNKLQNKNIFTKKRATPLPAETVTDRHYLAGHSDRSGKTAEQPASKNESAVATALPPAGSPVSDNGHSASNAALVAAHKTADVESPTPGMQIEAPNVATAADVRPVSMLSTLAGRFAPLQNTLNMGAIPAAQPVKPAKLLSGWYAAIQAAPQYTFSSKPEAPPRGGKPGDPRNKPAFVHRKEIAVQNTDTWIKVGKKMGTNFALETGFGYRNLTRNAEHKADFEFREGKHFPGGIGGRPSWSVSYNLNTYGGAASVELRADQADAGTVQDNEKLDFSIQTKQHLQMLRIPILAVAKIGHGRALGVLKAGLVGNFMIKNQLTITNATSNNTRFTLENKSGQPKPPFEKRTSFIPGYWVSAGLEYRLSRKISISAEPFVSGDFAQNTFPKGGLPSYYSAGLSAGVQYYF